MSTRSQIHGNDQNPAQPSDNLSTNFVEIPSCRIEDVDKALFDLFDKQLPLLFTHKKDTKRVPIVFATGERFALIARKKPLRDRSKALILPVISIMRTNIELGNSMGGSFAPDIPIIIKKQLSSKDAIYQRLLNKKGIKNSKDIAGPDSFVDPVSKQVAMPDRVATRRTQDDVTSTIGDLSPTLGNNIFEIFELPPPVYVTIDYEISVWTQYTQEMNNLLSVIATESHFHASPSFRIETSTGYTFVAYIDKTISNQSNFEDFSEEERYVRTSFPIKVTGYLVGSTYKGAPNFVKKYVSAPQISFEVSPSFVEQNYVTEGPPSGQPSDYLIDDLRNKDQPVPRHAIGGNDPIQKNYVETIDDPFSVKKIDNRQTVTVKKTTITKTGETVYEVL